jgi:hypothetical protein
MRIFGNPNRSLAIETEYEVLNPRGSVVYCSVLGIPELNGETFRVMAEFPGEIDFKCHSRAVDALVGLKWLGWIAVLGVVVAGGLHASGIVNVVDWVFPDMEKKRFDDLKRNPYASAIDPGDRPLETE